MEKNFRKYSYLQWLVLMVNAFTLSTIFLKKCVFIATFGTSVTIGTLVAAVWTVINITLVFGLVPDISQKKLYGYALAPVGVVIAEVIFLFALSRAVPKIQLIYINYLYTILKLLASAATFILFHSKYEITRIDYKEKVKETN